MQFTYDVQIYDWNNEMNLWVETSGRYFSDFTKETRDVLLHNNGTALGLIYKEGSFRLLHRMMLESSWNILPTFNDAPKFNIIINSNTFNNWNLQNNGLNEVFQI